MPAFGLLHPLPSLQSPHSRSMASSLTSKSSLPALSSSPHLARSSLPLASKSTLSSNSSSFIPSKYSRQFVYPPPADPAMLSDARCTPVYAQLLDDPQQPGFLAPSTLPSYDENYLDSFGLPEDDALAACNYNNFTNFEASPWTWQSFPASPLTDEGSWGSSSSGMHLKHWPDSLPSANPYGELPCYFVDSTSVCSGSPDLSHISSSLSPCKPAFSTSLDLASSLRFTSEGHGFGVECSENLGSPSPNNSSSSCLALGLVDSTSVARSEAPGQIGPSENLDILAKELLSSDYLKQDRGSGDGLKAEETEDGLVCDVYSGESYRKSRKEHNWDLNMDLNVGQKPFGEQSWGQCWESSIAGLTYAVPLVSGMNPDFMLAVPPVSGREPGFTHTVPSVFRNPVPLDKKEEGTTNSLGSPMQQLLMDMAVPQKALVSSIFPCVASELLVNPVSQDCPASLGCPASSGMNLSVDPSHVANGLVTNVPSKTTAPGSQIQQSQVCTPASPSRTQSDDGSVQSSTFVSSARFFVNNDLHTNLEAVPSEFGCVRDTNTRMASDSSQHSDSQCRDQIPVAATPTELKNGLRMFSENPFSSTKESMPSFSKEKQGRDVEVSLKDLRGVSHDLDSSYFKCTSSNNFNSYVPASSPAELNGCHMLITSIHNLSEVLLAIQSKRSRNCIVDLDMNALQNSICTLSHCLLKESEVFSEVPTGDPESDHTVLKSKQNIQEQPKIHEFENAQTKGSKVREACGKFDVNAEDQNVGSFKGAAKDSPLTSVIPDVLSENMTFTENAGMPALKDKVHIEVVNMKDGMTEDFMGNNELEGRLKGSLLSEHLQSDLEARLKDSLLQKHLQKSWEELAQLQDMVVKLQDEIAYERNEVNSIILIYKNLWKEAEGALTSSMYKLRKVKLELEESEQKLTVNMCSDGASSVLSQKWKLPTQNDEHEKFEGSCDISISSTPSRYNCEEHHQSDKQQKNENPSGTVLDKMLIGQPECKDAFVKCGTVVSAEDTTTFPDLGLVMSRLSLLKTRATETGIEGNEIIHPALLHAGQSVEQEKCQIDCRWLGGDNYCPVSWRERSFQSGSFVANAEGRGGGSSRVSEKDDLLLKVSSQSELTPAKHSDQQDSEKIVSANKMFKEKSGSYHSVVLTKMQEEMVTGLRNSDSELKDSDNIGRNSSSHDELEVKKTLVQKDENFTGTYRLRNTSRTSCSHSSRAEDCESCSRDSEWDFVVVS